MFFAFFHPVFTDKLKNSTEAELQRRQALAPQFGDHLAIEDYYINKGRPRVMAEAHWHGHVECNWLKNGSATYSFEGRDYVVPPDRFVIFWAGIPHRLTELQPTNAAPVEMYNLALPLDVFLFMQRVGPVQNALFSGEIMELPHSACDERTVARWVDDYTSKHPDRLECLKMEFNAMLRRALASNIISFTKTRLPKIKNRRGTSSDMHHVVAMIRAISNGLGQPISTKNITNVTGLNSNYASNLFSRHMHLSLKQFIIRMQVMHARQQLIETNKSVEEIIYEAGFSSTSQFYHHFKTLYKTTAGELRKRSDLNV